MKSLSETQARKCENAAGKRCSCRCHGALHGRKQIARDAPRENYEQLPDDDPHKLEPKMVKEKRIPERIRNLTPERAANMLRHARKILVDEWLSHLWDHAGAESVGESLRTLEIAESKVRLGVDEIRA